MKEILANPIVLFAVMYVAMGLSVVKQIASARQDGIEVPSCLTYLTKYWPESVTAVFGSALAFAGLIETNTLNFASALGIGYAANSLSDLIRSGGRSATLAGIPKQE